MTREEFVRRYAERSSLDDRWAGLGIIETDSRVMIALPCGCDDKDCDGWAMVSSANVLDHFFLHAPDKLRDAYLEAVRSAGGER